MATAERLTTIVEEWEGLYRDGMRPGALRLRPADWRADLVADLAIESSRCFVGTLLSLARHTQSPIEERLLYALVSAGLGSGMGVLPLTPGGGHSLEIRPQEKLGRYAADFDLRMVWLEHPEVRLIVECDGHDYHERTKAQARHDKQRDRALTAQGLTVLRFTGSEIYADADRCAEEILSQLVRMSMRR